MVDSLRQPFEEWVKSQGLRTYPLPGLDENELETLGVGPGAELVKRN